MKKLVSMTLCLLLIASVFTACGSGKTTSSASSASSGASSTASSGAAPDASASPDASMAPEGAGSATTSGSSSGTASETTSGAARELTEYRDALKEAYGEDYIPDRVYTEDEISEKLGISGDLYEEIYGEGSTLDENPDTFIAVKAKSGKADEVEKLLQDHKDSLLSDNKFEANKEKINSAQIVKEGDHVFLFILGKNDFGEEIADVAEGFKNEMQKGVDALKKLFS